MNSVHRFSGGLSYCGRKENGMSAYGTKRLLDAADYLRYAHFRHFLDEAPSSISLADEVDVTALRDACRRTDSPFYLSFLYLVTRIVNAHDEFRMTTVDAPDFEAPMPAVWDTVNPVHNVFHEERETYTNIVSLWRPDYDGFCRDAAEGMERARRLTIESVPCGENVFEASCVPWRHFTAVGLASDCLPLTPIIAWGRWREDNGHCRMPLSIQIHHAAADGYHLARFLNEAESEAERLADALEKRADGRL